MKKYFSSYWLRSAFYTILQRFSLTLFGLINFIILTRQLSKPELGTWALFLLITGIFEINKTNLLKNAHIKYVSGSAVPKEKSEIASSSFTINILITLLFILFLLVFCYPLGVWLNAGPQLALMLLWFIPGIIMMSVFSHLEAVQQSHLDFKGVFAGYFIRQLFFFGAILSHSLLKIPINLVQLALYQSASVLIGTVVLFIYTRKYLSYSFHPSMVWIKKILGFGGYIFGSGTVASIYQSLDQLMVARYMLPVHVATYNVASRINSLVDIPSYAAAEVLFPKVSQASVEDGTKRVKYLYEKMVGILLSFTLPAAIVIILFPSVFINIIAGHEYIEAAPILQLYMITGILRPAQNQAANLLNSIDKPKLCFYINVGYLSVNLFFNYICLQYFGFYGAAIGTVITFAIGAVVWYFIMKREIDLELNKIIKYGIDVYKMGLTILMNAFQKLQTRSKPV